MLLAMAKKKPFARFVGQDTDLRCVKITAINLALHNLYGYAIWGNSLANERKLAYATGFDGKGVIRIVADDELRAITMTSPITPQEPSEASGPITDVSQGSLFDDME